MGFCQVNRQKLVESMYEYIQAPPIPTRDRQQLWPKLAAFSSRAFIETPSKFAGRYIALSGEKWGVSPRGGEPQDLFVLLDVLDTGDVVYGLVVVGLSSVSGRLVVSEATANTLIFGPNYEFAMHRRADRIVSFRTFNLSVPSCWLLISSQHTRQGEDHYGGKAGAKNGEQTV